MQTTGSGSHRGGSRRPESSGTTPGAGGPSHDSAAASGRSRESLALSTDTNVRTLINRFEGRSKNGQSTQGTASAQPRDFNTSNNDELPKGPLETSLEKQLAEEEKRVSEQEQQHAQSDRDDGLGYCGAVAVGLAASLGAAGVATVWDSLSCDRKGDPAAVSVPGATTSETPTELGAVKTTTVTQPRDTVTTRITVPTLITVPTTITRTLTVHVPKED